MGWVRRRQSFTTGSPQVAFTRYCHHQYCMVYGIQRGGSVGGEGILRNGRPMVLQQCGQCRRTRRMKGRLIRAHATRNTRISRKGQFTASSPQPQLEEPVLGSTRVSLRVRGCTMYALTGIDKEGFWIYTNTSVVKKIQDIPYVPIWASGRLKTTTPTPTLTLTTTAMQMLPLMAATSFKHKGAQCLLTLGRSTSPPLDQFPVPVCSCPLCIINRP